MRSINSGCADIEGGARRRVRGLLEALDREIGGVVSSTMKVGATVARV